MTSGRSQGIHFENLPDEGTRRSHGMAQGIDSREMEQTITPVGRFYTALNGVIKANNSESYSERKGAMDEFLRVIQQEKGRQP